jgi:predicted dehydrogenase
LNEIIPLKIGLLGIGHLGKIHLKCLLELPEIWQIIGFFDPNDANSAKIELEFGIPRFHNLGDLLAKVDAVDIVTPTVTHFAMAEKAVLAGRHIFVEKPFTETVEEGRRLVELANRAGIVGQVGHVERFNPAFLSVKNLDLRPMFIESHRLSAFQPRGTDVSVILDLMIHDLDLVLSMVKSAVKTVSASGVAVLSDTPDIANARIEFENGCVANLTASRISMKQMRKMRLFQPDAYISLDFLEKNAQIVRLFEPESPDLPVSDNFMEFETPRGKRLLLAEQPENVAVNAIKMELETFGQSIQFGTPPPVPFSDGLAALELAHQILAEINFRQAQFPHNTF